MSDVVDQMRAWVGAARPPRADIGWYGACAGLTDRFIAEFTDGSRQWFDSATDARRASGPLNPDASVCPPGGVHFWSYTGTAWDGSYGDWGHVGPEIIGGGRGLLSATGYAYERWALNAGLITVAAQSARPGMRYLGWAATFGRAAPLIIDTPSAAGGNARPFTPNRNNTAPALKEADMLIFQVTKTWDGGGIQGQCYALGTRTVYVAHDQDEANSIAKRNNPTGALIPITDKELEQEFNARCIPLECMNMTGGGNWYPGKTT